ncbi:hypothetical protein [Roseobacter sp. SK209-2-6]|uniref:SLAC1 family transporter n=1 Tax=Roseobacter sp. SK209-2-6 TaxID=388739 RepID=UPI0012F4952F|nr:hypothetical protein [Roseobacter sp. SK209-2-6]
MKRTTLWRRTPPAVFPVCLGLMGLGLGWRNASTILPIAHEIGDLLLGFSTAYFLWFLVLYLAKLAVRPTVIFDDMKRAPARAGVAASAMCMMLLAAALLPLGVSVPQVWWSGVILQIAASAVVCWSLWREPAATRRFSPFQYLTFVGPIVGPIAGIPLGYVWQSIVLTYAALVAHVVISLGLTLRLGKTRPPEAMRPSLVIFLSPNCLFAISFGLLGVEGGFWGFYWFSNAVALLLLALTPWLIRGGWSPVWASFTFPLTAFLQMQVMAMQKGAGDIALFGVIATLLIATPLVLGIAYRFTLEWVSGELAEKSGAAEA